MSEFIQHLDADPTSDGLQFSTSILQQFFNNDKDYLKRTKESRSTGVEKELLKLNITEKKQLASSIEEYLNNLNFELQSGQSCKITTLLSNYPSSFAEAIKAVKSGEGKSLNIACALLSLHSVLQGEGRLGYEQSPGYADKYICKNITPTATIPVSLQDTKEPNKKAELGIGKVQLLSDKVPSGIFDAVAENHPLKTFTTVQQLQTYLIDQGYTLPKFGADGKRGKETKETLQKYLSDHKESKSPTTLPKESVSSEIIEKNIAGNEQEQSNKDIIIKKETVTSNSTESLPENNNFEQEKATIASKTLEIQELVSHKTPKDIEDYIDTLRNNKQEDPFIIYMAIMGGLNHINDSDRTVIINNYYTILGNLKKQRNTSGLSAFQDDIGIIEQFLAQHSEYCSPSKGTIGCDNSLTSLKDYQTKESLQFDCSSYSFFVYCLMSNFGHKNIGIAVNKAIEHGLFVRKSNESGNLIPYDFSNIKKNGTASGSQYTDGRNMKENIPTNIALLISEYKAPNRSLLTTYFALLCSQSVGVNGSTYYEYTLYDDVIQYLEKSYDSLFHGKDIIINDDNYHLAKDTLSVMMSEIHRKVGSKKGRDYSEEIIKLSQALRTYKDYL